MCKECAGVIDGKSTVGNRLLLYMSTCGYTAKLLQEWKRFGVYP